MVDLVNATAHDYRQRIAEVEGYYRAAQERLKAAEEDAAYWTRVLSGLRRIERTL